MVVGESGVLRENNHWTTSEDKYNGVSCTQRGTAVTEIVGERVGGVLLGMGGPIRVELPPAVPSVLRQLQRSLTKKETRKDGSELFGPTLAVRDNEAVDETLFNKFSLYLWSGG